MVFLRKNFAKKSSETAIPRAKHKIITINNLVSIIVEKGKSSTLTISRLLTIKAVMMTKISKIIMVFMILYI